MEGWIKIHRAIKKHWIYTDPEKLKAWICILIEVNHESKKVLIGGKLFECNRGESLNSLDTWARLFGGVWNKSKVRRFFDLLKKDSMIELKNESKTTRLIVCKYDSYQSERHVDETQMTRTRHGSDTHATPNKNVKNVKNDKNIFSFKKSLIDLGVDEKTISDWLKVRSKKKASNTETAFNNIKSQIEISGLSANECIKKAAENSWAGFKAEWINEPNKKQNINAIWNQ
jgi:hypothetical protein